VKCPRRLERGISHTLIIVVEPNELDEGTSGAIAMSFYTYSSIAGGGRGKEKEGKMGF
jgi:hypothetical protein